MSNSDSTDLQPEPPLDEKKIVQVQVTVRPRTSSSLSLATPRTARFTEATSIISPIEPPVRSRNPFTGSPILTKHVSPAVQPADVGFGYMDSRAIKHTSVEVPMTPFSPLRSALKPPGTPGRFIDPRSPTFKEEVALEKEEIRTEKENVNDLKVKTRVRVAKFFLRGVNFGCSLIVLAMLSTTFSIFNATRALPPRNNLPPWASGQQTWPQIALLCISCVSLAICMAIFWGYYRGGHRKATKTAGYYTLFAMGFFVFSTVMWVVGAAVLHSSKANGNGQDMWGWSCNTNKRATLFDDEVNYTLICRLQNWSLICSLIEIIVEVITIAIYAVVFYRFRSKRKLHNRMTNRDRARSDLYLAQLRLQSAPNTPGFKSMRSPIGATFSAHVVDDVDAAEKGAGAGYYTPADAEYAARHQQAFGGGGAAAADPKPFALQPAPARSTPRTKQNGFEPTIMVHAPVAPGEQTYDAVPIPGAYATALPSPGFAPPPQPAPQQQSAYFPNDVKHVQ